MSIGGFSQNIKIKIHFPKSCLSIISNIILANYILYVCAPCKTRPFSRALVHHFWWNRKLFGLIWWHWCWWHRDVGDLELVTILGFWWKNFDLSEIFWMLVPDAYVKDSWCWWPKWLKPSPISSIGHQHIPSPSSVINIDVTQSN